MDTRIIGQRRDRPEPTMRERRSRPLVNPVPPFDRAQFDRPGLEEQVALAGIGALGKCPAQFGLGWELIGPDHLGHRAVLMTEPILKLLERGGEVEDRSALLAGDHAAVGKAAAVKIAVHGKVDLMLFAAGAQEIAVERMGEPVRIDSPFGCSERLGDYLPAKYPANSAPLAPAGEAVLARIFDVEEFDQPSDKLFRSWFVFVHPVPLRRG